MNKIASRKEQRKAERKNKKQKKQPIAQKPKATPSNEKKVPKDTPSATPNKEKRAPKDTPAATPKAAPKPVPISQEVPTPSKVDAEEEEEDRYLRHLEKKLKIKDASKVLKSSLFKDDGLDGNQPWLPPLTHRPVEWNHRGVQQASRKESFPRGVV